MNKAQSFCEYTVLIAIIAAALIAMQIYLRRGLQGGLRRVGEQLGGDELMYSPGATNSNLRIITNATEAINTTELTLDLEARAFISNVTVNTNQTTNENKTILPLRDEPRRW